jgi:carbonic anhydrase
MNVIKNITLFSILCLPTLFGCNSLSKTPSSTTQQQHLLSADEQSKLTPDQVLSEFKEGNLRYKNSDVTKRYHTKELREKATGGQYPKAIVLSCVDSRVPVEDVFDQGIGDIFVGRVAGNFANTDLLGSMEFACKIAGAKLILVLAHQHCGAVKGAIDDVKMGHLTSLLKNIKPAVEKSRDFKGEQSSRNEAFVKYVAIQNVKQTINKIRMESPILREMESQGKIKIVGAFYTLRNGELEFID